jgi:Na+/H+-dicarboxylate symporter
MKLILKLFAGIILGILIGQFAPLFLVRVLITFKVVFGEFIAFIIPFIIFFFICTGIASLGSKSGRLLGLTTGLAYLSTIIAGTLAVIVGLTLIPQMHAAVVPIAEAKEVKPFFDMAIPPITGVITALVAAFTFGVSMSMKRSETLMKSFDEVRSIIVLVIDKFIIPLLPFLIAGIFAELVAAGTVWGILKTFGVILLLVLALQWTWLLILYIIAGSITKQNPFRLLKNMLPAYFTAVGTMSSAATIPVTLKQTRKNGVSEGITDFAIPLCATIHLSGSTITITTCAIATMLLTPGMTPPDFATMLPFVFMLGIIMVAAPGVPGGAVMAALGLFSTMLGFPKEAIGLMIALYLAQDSIGTACNVTGDGAIAVIVNRFFGKMKAPVAAVIEKHLDEQY